MTTEDTEDQQAYERRVRHRLKLLKRRFEEGRIKIPDDEKIKESLLAIRVGADGEIDLNTVNGVVRSMALAIEAVERREEMKRAIPLRDVQEMYFSYIKNNFGSYYKAMLTRGLDPDSAAYAISQNQAAIQEIEPAIPGFLDSLLEFWRISGDATSAHVADMHNVLKGIYGGDLFPTYEENIASKCGIYTDTIVLPDPFLRSKSLFPVWNVESRVYYLIKHALNLLQYRDLALADLDVPIVVVVPDQGVLDDDERDFLVRLGKEDSLIHAEKLFGRRFESFDEVREFVDALNSVDKLAMKIVDPTRLLFDTHWGGSVEAQLSKALTDRHLEILGTQHPGEMVLAQFMGRMAVSNEILIKSQRFHGVPILDAPTSWQYFSWKLEYDAARMESQSGLADLHVTRGLQHLAKSEMRWLGRVPLDALIEIRKEGALSEIRAMLSSGVEELATVKPENFHRTTDRVLDNIQNAFEEHERKIDELSNKKWKFAGKDIGSWLAVGTLEVGAAATGMPVYGLSALLAHQFFDVPKFKDIPASIRALADEDKSLRRSPVGLLFKYRGA